MPLYPIQILSIHIAPDHKIFGKTDEDLSGADLISLSKAQFIADSGIEGDRFCRHRPKYNGHVTFFSAEVWEAITESFELNQSIGPEILRRNILVSGVDLKALYGQAFSIQGIQFLGTVHCAPCTAMNRALGDGARAALRDRGGLRAQVKSGGRLRLGKSDLATNASMIPNHAATRPDQPSLP